MIKALAHFLGVRLARPIYGGIGSIIALHRVVPEAERSHLKVNRALEITPENLAAMIGLLRKRKHEFIPLDDVPMRLRSRRRDFVAFTLDDGYRDNLVHALPIFREHGVPFTVNATRSFSEHRESVWWFALEDVLCTREKITVEHGGRQETLLLSSPAQREEAFVVLAAWIRQCQLDERRDLLAAIFEPHGIDPLDATRRLVMNEDELKELARQPFASLGAHTLHHLVSNVLGESALRVEFSSSKKWLETLTGQPIRNLAYPFGGKNAVGAREFRVAQECGFITGVTTRFGNLFHQHSNLLHRLPRLEISGNYRVPQFTERAVSGLLPAMRNHWRRIVEE